MTDRIDHAVKAREALEILAGIWGEDLAVDEVLAGAQVNATLAIVEQLRIGNLIALLEHLDGDAYMPRLQAIEQALGIEVQS